MFAGARSDPKRGRRALDEPRPWAFHRAQHRSRARRHPRGRVLGGERDRVYRAAACVRWRTDRVMARLLACGDGDPRREPHHEAPAIRAGRIRWLRRPGAFRYLPVLRRSLPRHAGKPCPSAGGRQRARRTSAAARRASNRGAHGGDHAGLQACIGAQYAANCSGVSRGAASAAGIGLNTWVFDTVPEAEAWLEGRALGGPMVS